MAGCFHSAFVTTSRPLAYSVISKLYTPLSFHIHKSSLPVLIPLPFHTVRQLHACVSSRDFDIPINRVRTHSFATRLSSMADCDSGLTFAREGKADCTHVKETCAYATCDDTTGSHCYGLDSSLGYPAGYLNTSFSTKCEGDWKCPLAWQYGYPIGLQDTPP